MEMPTDVELGLTETAIPEAVIWKRNILKLYFYTVLGFSHYHASDSGDDMIGTLQENVISLFLSLKLKFDKVALTEDDKKYLGILERFIISPRTVTTNIMTDETTIETLTIETLYYAFIALQKVIEGLKITVPESPGLSKDEAFRDMKK